MAAPFENPADFYLWARSLAAATRQILSISALATLCLSQTADAHLAERTPAQILGAFRLTPGRLPGVDHASFPTLPAPQEGARRSVLTRALREGRSALLIDLAFGETIRQVLRSRSAASSGQDPRRACELSALYLGLSAEGDEPLRHAARALTWAEAALRHQPDQGEALFNRALALERLSLKKDAAAAWEQYLAIDADSPWAEEARQRHRRLIDTVSPEKQWQEARRELETASPARVAEIVQEHVQPGRLWVSGPCCPAGPARTGITIRRKSRRAGSIERSWSPPLWPARPATSCHWSPFRPFDTPKGAVMLRV